MFKQNAIHYFGSQQKTAEALGISQPAIANWKNIIPQKQALILERLTEGKLVYDPSLYRKVSQSPDDVNV
ncbi:Cro/CI family transcriptional regulator [Veronia pacifica]|uniref:Cro/Cl family transcriptional regulator n=1 Tax=Veronia pacifica TaxID=1080227 RepID=A0A1C3EL66_9GAMM|nr:Cro/CI family transcriptional regulator [Veronia pacifica]ODA33983.1 hypothetical protein A8L45_08025 [Veronia pacifica]